MRPNDPQNYHPIDDRTYDRDIGVRILHPLKDQVIQGRMMVSQHSGLFGFVLINIVTGKKGQPEQDYKNKTT